MGLFFLGQNPGLKGQKHQILFTYSNTYVVYERARFSAGTSSSESPSRSTTSGALRTRGCGTGGPRFRTAGGFGAGGGGRNAGFRASQRSQHGPFP